MVVDTNQKDEDPTFFTGTRIKIAPPGWQYHETDTQGEGAVNYWTHTDGGEVTTYLPGEVFVAKHPSYLKLWHVCHYQFYQIDAETQDETHICDFYVNFSTHQSYDINPMHHYLATKLIQINNELKILPPNWSSEKSSSGKSYNIMVEPDDVFSEKTTINDQKWETKFSIQYLNEVYQDGETTHIHLLQIEYANKTTMMPKTSL